MNLNELIEIELNKPDNFLKIVETLTRIGLASRSKKRLTQTAHILQKRGKYYIVHFKQLFSLDGRETDINDLVKLRVKVIANLLEDWDLCTICDDNNYIPEDIDMEDLKIVRFQEKKEWELVQKYTIGKKR